MRRDLNDSPLLLIMGSGQPLPCTMGNSTQNKRERKVPSLFFGKKTPKYAKETT